MPGGMPGGGGQLMFIEGRWVDRASPEFQKSMQKMKGEAKKQSTQVGDLVNENMGRSMKAFNEKTEKGRMLMTAMGTTVGGQATYMAGNILYVVGAFKKWELVAMGVMGAVVALGAKLYQMAESDLKAATKAMEELNKENERFIKQKETMIEMALASLAGMSKEAMDIREIRKQYSETSVVLEQYRAEREKLLALVAAGGDPFGVMAKNAEKADENIRKAEDAMRKYADMIKMLKAISGIKGRTKLLPEDITTSGGGFLGMFGMGIAEGVTRAMGEASWEADLARRRKKMEEEYEQQQFFAEQVRSLEEEEAQRTLELKRLVEEEKQRIAEESMHVQMEIERQRVEAMHETITRGIGLFGELGELVTRGTKAQSAVRIAAIVLEAGYQAAMEMARGFASLAQPWLAAAHFTAAGLFAAVAAGKIANVASGGGRGGSSVGARESAQGGWGRGDERREQEPMTFIVYIGEERVDKIVVNALDRAEDRRNPGRKRPRVI